MPSVARKYQLQMSLVYHVLNRGNARQALFHEAADYQHFVRLLVKYGAKHNIQFYHWALMENHYHLCLELSIPGALSSIMAGIQRAYVHYHHRKYQSAGFLFQGRFKSKPIQKERYLLACGRYIEQNPLKAGVVDRAESYCYSSGPFYVIGAEDGLTTPDPFYETFGCTPKERQAAYRIFLEQDEESGHFERFDVPLGDEEFQWRLIRKRGRFVGRRRLAFGTNRTQHLVNQQIK